MGVNAAKCRRAAKTVEFCKFSVENTGSQS